MKSAGRALGWAAGAASAAAVVALAASGNLPGPAELRDLLVPLGPWAAPIFVLLFAVGTVLALPAVVFAATGAYVFGLWGGLTLSLAGATLGAGAAFLVARRLGRPLLARRLAASPRWRRVDRSVARHGAVVVLLLRVLPVLPFNLLNYLLGLTGIRFASYLAATLVGMVPGAFVYSYAAVQLGAATEGRAEAPGLVMAAVLLAAFLLVLPLAWRRADRRAGGRLLEQLAERWRGGGGSEGGKETAEGDG